nr:MAG TPA: hypothetical protein [Bacteriophage sp.]
MVFIWITLCRLYIIIKFFIITSLRSKVSFFIFSFSFLHLDIIPIILHSRSSLTTYINISKSTRATIYLSFC